MKKLVRNLKRLVKKATGYSEKAEEINCRFKELEAITSEWMSENRL